VTFAPDELTGTQKKILDNTLKDLRSGKQSQIGDFSRFALPLIKKVSPQLIAADLVKVQPMTTPSSLPFYLNYLNYRYATQPDGIIAWVDTISPCGMRAKPYGGEIFDPDFNPTNVIFSYKNNTYWFNLNKNRVWHAMAATDWENSSDEIKELVRMKQVPVGDRKELVEALVRMI